MLSFTLIFCGTYYYFNNFQKSQVKFNKLEWLVPFHTCVFGRAESRMTCSQRDPQQGLRVAVLRGPAHAMGVHGAREGPVMELL